MCQLVITYFDNELLKNETLAELGEVLEKGCEMLPTPLTSQVSWGGAPSLGGTHLPPTGSPPLSIAVRGARGAVRAGGRPAPCADDGSHLRLHRKCPRAMGHPD